MKDACRARSRGLISRGDKLPSGGHSRTLTPAHPSVFWPIWSTLLSAAGPPAMSGEGRSAVICAGNARSEWRGGCRSGPKSSFGGSSPPCPGLRPRSREIIAERCGTTSLPGQSPFSSPTSRGRRSCFTSSALGVRGGAGGAPARDPRGVYGRGRGGGRHSGRRVLLRLRDRARGACRGAGVHRDARRRGNPSPGRDPHGLAVAERRGLRRRRRSPRRPGRLRRDMEARCCSPRRRPASSSSR